MCPGQSVWVQEPDNHLWKHGTVTQSGGDPSSYQIRLHDGSALHRMKLHLKPRYPASDSVQQDTPSDPIPDVPALMPVPEPYHSLPALVKQKVKAPPPSFSPMKTRSASRVTSRLASSVSNSKTSSRASKGVPPVIYPQGVTGINIVTMGHINMAWTIVCSVNN